MASKNLVIAKNEKKDEFYTRLEDIENELQYYTQHFKGKVVYLNADDPRFSNFWKYFKDNFEQLQLKELISTHFVDGDSVAYITRLTKDGEERKPLDGNGDFRSEECVEFLLESDIVVTNPPFSLFRALIDLLVEYKKDFILIGNQNSITYKNVFPLLKSKKARLGNNGGNMYFKVPEGYGHRATNLRFDDEGNKYISVKGIRWFTTLEHGQTPPPIELTKAYKGNEDDYPKYDNYDAINVDRVKNIPTDYDGVMGVPITFLVKWSPEQFEVLGLTSGRDEFDEKAYPTKRYQNAKQHNKNGTIVNGGKANSGPAILLESIPDSIYYTADNADGPFRIPYARILIRNLKPEQRIN